MQNAIGDLVRSFSMLARIADFPDARLTFRGLTILRINSSFFGIFKVRRGWRSCLPVAFLSLFALTCSNLGAYDSGMKNVMGRVISPVAISKIQ